MVTNLSIIKSDVQGSLYVEYGTFSSDSSTGTLNLNFSRVIQANIDSLFNFALSPVVITTIFPSDTGLLEFEREVSGAFNGFYKAIGIRK